MVRSQCRHVDEQYRQHLESEHDDGRNCAVQHSQTLLLSQFADGKSLPIDGSFWLDWEPYVDTTVVYVLRGLMIQPILPTIRTRTRARQSNRRIPYSEMERRRNASLKRSTQRLTHTCTVHCNMWSQASVQGRGRT